MFPLSQAKTKGMDIKIDIGVKYADKQARHFDNEKIKAGQCVIGLQVTMQPVTNRLMSLRAEVLIVALNILVPEN